MSPTPDFGSGTCTALTATGNSALLPCLRTAFTDTVYARVGLTDAVVATAPATQFNFRPTPPADAATSVVNHTPITCGVTAAWPNTDADTTYYARIARGASVVEERQVGNPIPGTFGPSPLDATISYETQATDTGQDVSCTVTAANGVNTSSSTQTYP